MSEKTKQSRRSAGRPVDENISNAILDAAQTLFFKNGPAGTPMEAIANAAGVAKTTLYGRYSSKEQILDAVISRLAKPLEDSDTLHDETLGVEQALMDYGMKVVTLIERNRSSGLQALLMAQAKQNPDFAKKYFAAGPGRVRKRLANAIDIWIKNGRIKTLDNTDNPEAMADELISQWQGLVFVEANLTHTNAITTEKLTTRVKRGTRNFIHLYGNERKK